MSIREPIDRGAVCDPVFGIAKLFQILEWQGGSLDPLERLYGDLIAFSFKPSGVSR